MNQPDPVQQVRIATALLQALIVVYTIWFAGVAYVFKTAFNNPGTIGEQLTDFVKVIRSIAASSAALQTILSLTVLVLSRYSSPLLTGTLITLLLMAGVIVRTIQEWVKEVEREWAQEVKDGPPTGMYWAITMITAVSSGGAILIILNPWLLEIF